MSKSLFQPTHKAAMAPLDSPASVQPSRQSWRFGAIAIFFGLLASIIFLRLFSYQAQGANQALLEETFTWNPNPRGVIVDRDGALLASDRFFFEVSATPNRFKSDEARTKIALSLESLINVPAAEIVAILHRHADQQFCVLATDINIGQRDRLLEEKSADEEKIDSLFQYIHVNPTPRRFYPQGELAGQLIGFVDITQERRAYYGVEEYYDRFLRRDGVGLTSRQRQPLESIPGEVRRYIPSVAGKDLVLTIDRTIQWIVEDELQKGLNKYRARSGTIIVMEPETGAILALANLPTYNPNDYGTEPQEYFSNAAVSAQYEPGSIFKIITFAAALDQELITPEMLFEDSGSIIIGQREILNSDRFAHGEVSATQALARSLNVVTAQIVEMVGHKSFYQYIKRFGFGEATKIDLANEVKGLLKTPGTTDWSLSDLGTNSFGQGVAVTPIQMISAATSIANGGKLMRPYIVQTRIHNGRVQETQPTVVRTAITPEAAESLSEMMVDVVELGTQAARVSGYAIAGKSGTAQIPTKEGYTEDETIVSFVGFAPAEEPKFVVLVKMDRPDPSISPWASYTAAPVFSRVAKRLLDHLNIPPDNVRVRNY